MLKVVFDTNIYISAFLFGGNPEQLLRHSLADKFILYTSPDIIHEVASVLAKKFNYTPNQIDQVTELVENFAIIIRPTKTINAIKGWPADNRILECASTAKANYLVTGDKKHILPLEKFEKTKIVTTQQFLEIISSTN